MSELFSRSISGDNVGFKHAKGVSDRSGKEFHLFHEIILFLGGQAELISETVHTALHPQTLIVIPKETYHQLVISGDPSQYCRCVFQFSETAPIAPLIETGMQELFISKSNKATAYLFSKMMQLAKDPDPQSAPTIAEAVLCLLLDEICAMKSTAVEKDLTDDLTRQAIDYITAHLTNPIHIQTIARHLNVSPSTLMHTFKQNMNISIHKYIIKKRLILAHAKISGGEPAIAAAAECGFGDYSGFYKQYKAMFDTTPSSHTRA